MIYNQVVDVIRSLISLIFPDVCHCCGEVMVSGEKMICTRCISKLPRTNYHLCRTVNAMEERFIGRINFERATGYFAYSRGSKFANLVHDFKYRKYPSLAAVFGELIGRELLIGGFFADSDLIVPIPVHFMKRMRRGYNQSEFFARGLSASTGIKISYCLGARRNHKTQTGKTLEERTSNVSGIFRVQRPELLKGKHLVIADDVCTTGSTLCEAVRTIDEATAHTCRFTLLTIGVTV